MFEIAASIPQKMFQDGDGIFQTFFTGVHETQPEKDRNKKRDPQQDAHESIYPRSLTTGYLVESKIGYNQIQSQL